MIDAIGKCLLASLAITFFANGPQAHEPQAAAKKKPRKPTVQVTISKETTRITKPLRADGYVDYLKALNDHAGKGVTPKNNAAVLFWRAMGPKDIEKTTSKSFYKLLKIEPLAAEGDYFIDFHDYVKKQKPAATQDELDELWYELGSAAERPWTKKDHPRLAGWLAANEKPLRLVVEGSRRPHCYWPLVGSVEDTDLISVLMPGLQGCRAFTRALCARAMLHAGSGRIDEAWADVMACHRLARLTGRGPTLIDGLVGIALEHVACKAGAALARHGDLSAKQAKRFTAELVKLPRLDGMAEKFDMSERYMFLDCVRIVAQNGPDVLSQISGEVDKSWAASLRRLATNALVDWDHVLSRGNSWYDRMSAAARLPTRAGRRKAFANISADVEKVVEETRDSKKVLARIALGESPRKVASEAIGNLFVAILLPATSTIDNAADKATARLDLTRLSLALAALKAESGSYPAKLADLSPKYLAKVPKDVFSAADFHYRAGKGGYRLWSIGPNGRDDDGMGSDVEDYEGDGDDLLIATGP
jgi:hypothetical protein